MTDWRRDAKRRMIWPALIFLAGLVLVLTGGENSDRWIIGGGVMGVAVTIAIALVFLEIGLSEDREREGK